MTTPKTRSWILAAGLVLASGGIGADPGNARAEGPASAAAQGRIGWDVVGRAAPAVQHDPTMRGHSEKLVVRQPQVPACASPGYSAEGALGIERAAISHQVIAGSRQLPAQQAAQ